MGREGDQESSAADSRIQCTVAGILDLVAQHGSSLRGLGVRKIGLLGSYARGTPRAAAIWISWWSWCGRFQWAHLDQWLSGSGGSGAS